MEVVAGRLGARSPVFERSLEAAAGARGEERSKNRLAVGAGADMLCPTKRMITPAACVDLGALRGAVDNISDRPQSRRTAEQRGGVDRQAQGRLSPSARQGQEGGTGKERSRGFCLGRIGSLAGRRATFRISFCGWSHSQAKASPSWQGRRGVAYRPQCLTQGHERTARPRRTRVGDQARGWLECSRVGCSVAGRVLAALFPVGSGSPQARSQAQAQS